MALRPAVSPARRPGTILRVNGPLVEVRASGVAVSDTIELGPAAVLGEAVAVEGETVTVQAYEYTGGLRPGDPARTLGAPLSARLGPGLLGGVFDGMLRPLQGAPEWLTPGRWDRVGELTPMPWRWRPLAEAGSVVAPGSRLGLVLGAGALEHRVLVAPGAEGELTRLRPEGPLADDPVVGEVSGREVSVFEPWPVRTPRPVAERLAAEAPLVTGQRVLDLLYPVALGGTAMVPGGFGTGKTVLLQQIAKWCDADVIVYVACGERGNELVDATGELGELEDPRSGGRLLERTVIIANTSNMPVMAREASVYTGMTVAEYYRDMGYRAVVIADSTSRWAEALREFSSRSGALPAEEGYPASLASALAAFYERAGAARTLGGERGSLTLIAAVSPPGGDMTEPVTANSQRFARCLWSLDRNLAYSRHYPALSWTASFSLDSDAVAAWHAAAGRPAWASQRARLQKLLGEADRLSSVAELVGVAALAGPERVVLLSARLIRDALLAQSALSANDAYCALPKQSALAGALIELHERATTLVAGGTPVALVEQVDFTPLVRAGEELAPDDAAGVEARAAALFAVLERLG